MEVALDDHALGAGVSDEPPRPSPSPDGARKGELEAAIERDHVTLESEWRSYAAIPPFPGERDRWAAILADMTTTDKLVRAAFTAHRSAGAAGADVPLTQAKAAFDRLDGRLHDLLALNARSAVSLGTEVVSLRRQSRWWALVLDTVSAFFALVVAFTAIRLVRTYARLMEERVSELEHFAGRVAHDIRGPLSSVGLALNLAERTASEPKLKAMLARGSRTLQRTGQLIDGLLVFARAGARPPSEVRATVKDVIAGVVEDLAPVADEKDIELCVAEVGPEEVVSSAGVLTSLISNLAVNAVKYMGDAPIRRVTLRARAVGNRVRVEVEDTGPGIPRALHARIFDPYVRGGDSGAPGLGLGLATVRRLAEAHGGQVGVDSREGSGSLFWFELPRAGG
jgi:signal transduction histidine kinase